MNALKKILSIIILITILIPQEGVAQSVSVPFSIEYEGDGNNHSILLPIDIPPEIPSGVDLTFNFSVIYEIVPYDDSWTSQVSFSMTSSDGDTIVPTKGPNLPGSSDDNIPIFEAVDGTYTINIDDISGGFYINVQDNFDNTELDGHFFGFMEYLIPFPCVVGTPCDDNDPSTTSDQLDENCNCMGTATVCEIIASASSPICSDNGTPSDPSDDTFTFEITVVNGTGTLFNDDMGNAGLPYGLAVSYGPFPVSDGGVTVTFSDAVDAGCVAIVDVIPPAACSDDVPEPPEIQPLLNIIPNDNCGMTNNVYGDVLSNVDSLHFQLFSCPDDTSPNPNVYPEFDEAGQPHIPGMTPEPNHIEKFEDIPSTTFCIQNVMPGRYYLLVWNDLLQYDIECFIVPPALEVIGPVIVPQDKTGKKHNAYFFVKGGVKPYKKPTFYQCPEGTPDDFQPGTNSDGSPDVSGMTEIQQDHLEYNGFLCIQNLDAGRHYVLIQDSVGRWKWICYETPKELQATLDDFIPAWAGDTRVYVDVCGGEPDYKYNFFTCPEPAPDELPTPKYAADGTLVVEGMTEVSSFNYTQVTPERICIDLPPGTYYLLVRDSGGRCLWVCIDISVVEPLDAELLEVVPFDDEHVRVYVKVTGGVPPYHFQPYTCPYPGTTPSDPTFPDGQPQVPDMLPFHDYDWVWNTPNIVCFTFPKDLGNIYILFWGQAFCWDWLCVDLDEEFPPPLPVYCDAQGQDTSKAWIEHVGFCDINNTSGNDGGYGNHTAMVAEVAAGQTQQIVLTPQFSSFNIDVRWYVWIDFNQDGTFGFNELVVKSPYSSTPVSATVHIPSNAVAGPTGMRVKMVIGKSLLVNPCGNFRRGEVEDYTVNISGNNGLVVAPATQQKRNLPNINLAIKIFPNPVREQATIEFELTDDSPVTLVVADAKGRPITTLIDNERLSEGIHQATFDGSDLPVGMYYCTLRVNNIIKTERISLLK